MHQKSELPNQTETKENRTKESTTEQSDKPFMQWIKGGQGIPTDNSDSDSGNSLPGSIQAKMENAFQTNFADVKVHKEDNSATDMGAKAYTQGNNIHFAPGQFQPESNSGQELIGHELTHVVQQRNANSVDTPLTIQRKKNNVNSDSSLENEADEMGRKAVENNSVNVLGVASGVQMKQEDEETEKTIGIGAGVGVGMPNNMKDVELVRNQLSSFGLKILPFNLIVPALGMFQSQVMGIEPNYKITPKDDTDQAMVDHSGFINQLNEIEENINEDFDNSVTEVNSDFEYHFREGTVINQETKVEEVNILALSALITRLNDFGANILFLVDPLIFLPVHISGYNNWPEEFKAIIKTALDKVKSELINVQKSQKIEHWSTDYKTVNRKQPDEYKIIMLTGEVIEDNEIGEVKNHAYNEGEIAFNDATYLFLQRFKEHHIEWEQNDDSQKKVKLKNFRKSGSTTNEEGVRYNGDLSTDSWTEQELEAIGISESDRESLGYVSSHEGGFDAVNTYDRKLLSFGFIQFAGEDPLEYLFALLKHNKPDVFQNYFGKYGIDVNYRLDSNSNVKLHGNKIIAHIPELKQTLEDRNAKEYMSRNPIYAAIMIRAAESKDVQEIQWIAGKNFYIDKHLVKSLEINIKALTISSEGEGGPKNIVERVKSNEWSQKIKEYKKKQEFQTNKENGHINEIDLTINGLTYGDVVKSRYMKAGYCGACVKNPRDARETIINAITIIAVEKGLTTASQIKDIDQNELLEKCKNVAVSNVEDRFKDVGDIDE